MKCYYTAAECYRFLDAAAVRRGGRGAGGRVIEHEVLIDFFVQVVVLIAV